MPSLPTPATESDSPVQPARHQTGLITILFTDLVGSTALKQQVGDRTGASLIQQHHALVRELLRFGEVWLGRHQHTKERRVFKFCFQAERVRFLKREMTLFRLLKERVGDHANIVRLHDIILDQPPFYVEMDYVEGADLRTWSEECEGVASVPLETRLEIAAQAADGLQAAHEA